MSIRYVIRPAAIGRTPRLLAERLNAETRRYPGTVSTLFDWRRDLFLIYPPSRAVAFGDGTDHPVYEELHSFYGRSKAHQRQLLSEMDVRIPTTATTITDAERIAPTHSGSRRDSVQRFIVRPLRHSGGRGYRLTDNPTDFTEGEEYVQRLYPKDREYRIIFVFGKPLITLVKKVPEGLSNEEPWNHTNGASFSTINNARNNPLLETDCYQRLEALPIIIHSHIIAADILWSHNLGYVVCELNTCPGLTIPANLERISQYVESHR